MSGPVTVRLNRGFRILVVVLITPVLIGILLGVATAIRERDPRATLDVGDSTAALVVGWGIVGVIGSVLALVWVFALRFRETIDPVAGATYRGLVRTHRLAAADVTSIDVVSARLPGRAELPRSWRVTVAGPSPSTRRLTLGFDSSMTSAGDALTVVDRWVQARPGLLASEDARRFFELRGTLSSPAEG